VHIAAFAAHVKFSDAQIESLANGGATDSCWGRDEQLLLTLCDQLHTRCAVDDELWRDLNATFTDEAIMELLMVAGFCRTVSHLTNGLKLPAEPGSARFAILGTG
jgi:alkylhydroperoxidase family enzyme